MALTPSASATIVPRPTPIPTQSVGIPIAAAASPTDIQSPQSTSGMSLTSREWVIPPRPKPGRKPATDTPPTKRKAQNRAAQRAFRERRAAKVGELEDQLKQIEDENEQEQDALRSHITNLERQLESCQADLIRWAEKFRLLEQELASVRQTSQQRASSSETNVNEMNADDPIGCGNCTLETRCQCIDDAVAAMTDAPSEEPKRQHSSVPESHKRIKLEPTDQEVMEVDFTTLYARRPPVASVPLSRPPPIIVDPCGFCQDGTPCICAEMATEQHLQQTSSGSHSPHATRATLSGSHQFTPPPSEGDVTAIITKDTRTVCTGVPGTCAQCQTDPNSTLFCKSLAASRARPDITSSEVQSVPLPSRQTRSRNLASTSSTVPPPPVKAITLSCADAYTALSRHRAYEQASGDMASWMPKLHAAPSHAHGSRVMEGRHPLEIDAANVMAVLKDFDRRFGRSR